MNYICFYHSPCNDGEMSKIIWKHKYPKTIFFLGFIQMNMTMLNFYENIKMSILYF